MRLSSRTVAHQAAEGTFMCSQRVACSAMVKLTGIEYQRLDAQPDGAHQLQRELRCEFESHHDGPHCALAQQLETMPGGYAGTTPISGNSQSTSTALSTRSMVTTTPSHASASAITAELTRLSGARSRERVTRLSYSPRRSAGH